jgi:hypothetical protein
MTPRTRRPFRYLTVLPERRPHRLLVAFEYAQGQLVNEAARYFLLPRAATVCNFPRYFAAFSRSCPRRLADRASAAKFAETIRADRTQDRGCELQS